MSLKRIKYVLIIFILAVSCQTEEEKLSLLNESEKLTIQVNSYGGLGGYSESAHKIIRNKSERYFILYLNEDYQKRINFPKEKDALLTEFLKASLSSNKPNREHKYGCIGPTDRVYELSCEGSRLTLSPNVGAHELFDQLTKK